MIKNGKNYNPISKKESIIQGDKYRISILTSRLIRLEYSEDGIFEDRMTKGVVNRDFPPVNFKVYDRKDRLKIVTDHVTILYDKKPFSTYGLSVELRGKVNNPYYCIWHYGDKIENLGGTARTLDFAESKVEIGDGILSRYGISVIDDSSSPIISDDGWTYERNNDNQDLYVFAYKDKYLDALDDFYKLSGSQPLLPRYALGNWWSRFYNYSKEDYLDLVDKFEKFKAPFSVMVLDMLWHTTGIDEKYGSDWTGYTWNYDLLGEPRNLFSSLHDNNYKVTLNLHPSSGIRPSEDFYEDMAKELGYDYENEETIDFSYKDRAYADCLNKYFYKPFEEKGVDFWWMDWQQSPRKLDENKDALWVINRTRFLDMEKSGKRALTFSRFAGLGSQRYPIGFSGDTSINWETLDFQPYFTATSSNIGFGWWSHDIGGHMKGATDPELMLRWLQFGVFSPINRLHSSNTAFVSKEPWSFDEKYSKLMVDYLQIRHKLIPYIHTMNYKACEENIPLIRPIYYYYPNDEGAYANKNQYYFGESLLVTPMTKKIDSRLQMAEFKAFLPDDGYYDLQTGLFYAGQTMIEIYRPIDKMGLFIKKGGIIPLADLDKDYTNSIENPKALKVLIGAGKDGIFNLIEDSEENLEAKSITQISYEDKRIIMLDQSKTKIDIISTKRDWTFEIYGIRVNEVEIVANKDNRLEGKISYNQEKNLSQIIIEEIPSNEDIEILIKSYEEIDQKTNKLDLILSRINSSRIETLKKESIFDIVKNAQSISNLVSALMAFDIEEKVKKSIFEIIFASEDF